MSFSRELDDLKDTFENCDVNANFAKLKRSTRSSAAFVLSSRKMASGNNKKQFQFKPIRTNKPALNLVTKPSMSPAANKKGVPNAADKNDNDDIWMDDIDDCMLIQASQMAEATIPPKNDLMDLDDDALTMFIKEEESRDKAAGAQGASTGGQRYNQTQTVFHSTPIMPPPTTACKKNRANNVGPKSMDGNNGELEKLRAERNALIQKEHAKMGEISFLRAELAKSKAQTEAARRDNKVLAEARDAELRRVEAAKRAALEAERSKNEFMRRELDQATDRLRQVEGGMEAATAAVVPPRPAKRQRRAVPDNIDASLMNEGHVVTPKAATHDVRVQTLAQRDIRLVLCQDETGSPDFVAAGTRRRDFDSVQMVSEIVGSVEKIVEIFRADPSDADVVDKVETLLDNVGDVVDSLPGNFDGVENLKAVFDNIFSLFIHKEFSGYRRVAGRALNLLNCILGRPDLRPLVDLTGMFSGLKRGIESHVDTASFFAQVVTVLASNASWVMPKICTVSKDSCFLYVLWNFVSHLDLATLAENEVEVCTRSASAWASSCSALPGLKLCDFCRSELLKILVTFAWTVVFRLADGRGENLVKLPRTCLHALHSVWVKDPDDFLRNLVASSDVQRRYVWTIKYWRRAGAADLGFSKDEEALLVDLSVESEEQETKNAT